MNKRETLRKIMEDHDLNAHQIADILTFYDKKTTANNVYGWLSINQTRPMPDTHLKILELTVSGTTPS